MSADSFLPRIQSVFYAVFDVDHGPKIVYQVPESLIATHNSPLFNFDDISKYVIPPSQLCGRIVICATKLHRIIGFPVELHGSYRRNYFRYNLCFVFERTADLSCYEPIVRKVSSVLSACEKESNFLSNPQTSTSLHAILEQLYEDLNSYSETSILIDRFNSIELKIFPFYPNPPAVKDWMVPLALINITKRIDDNWDLTMVKVCKYIDGTNHVSRIAQLADCDISLTRQAISHLLFYQVIMTVDIFQYSNMYTLRKSMQWLADEVHVREECGPYVTKPGHPIPDWPKLLRLYSRLKPGKTVLEWMESHNVHQLGIDIRRFTSFGVIKGFLRRVHRWPVLLPLDLASMATASGPPNVPPLPPGEHESLIDQSLLFPTPPSQTDALSNHPPKSASNRGRSSSVSVALQSTSPRNAPALSTTPQDSTNNIAAASVTVVPISATHRARRASAAEKALEQLRSRADVTGSSAGLVSTPRTSWIHFQQKDEAPSENQVAVTASQDPPTETQSRRQSLLGPIGPPPSPVLAKVAALPPTPAPPAAVAVRPRSTWLMPGLQSSGVNTRPFPPELLGLLDGEHHTDELVVRFKAGWPVLEGWLIAAERGTGDSNFGRVCIIYR
ncbi:NPR2-domain-containing protein [Tricholoma matsutake]|nr:NPR2-domain-containing protein [Tricholoma matsutake 945]